MIFLCKVNINLFLSLENFYSCCRVLLFVRSRFAVTIITKLLSYRLSSMFFLLVFPLLFYPLTTCSSVLTLHSTIHPSNLPPFPHPTSQHTALVSRPISAQPLLKKILVEISEDGRPDILNIYQVSPSLSTMNS